MIGITACVIKLVVWVLSYSAPVSLSPRCRVGEGPGNEVASVICLHKWIYPKNIITSENKPGQKTDGMVVGTW